MNQLKKILATDLRLGQTVRMAHVPCMPFGAMMVVQISSDTVLLHRIYLVQSSDSVQKNTVTEGIRPLIGIEPVEFLIGGSMVFDLLSDPIYSV